MTLPAAPSGIGRRIRTDHGVPHSNSQKARIFLAAACLWPLVIMALFASSSPRTSDGSGQKQPASANSLRSTFRNALDRVDVMGYGPTHPRIAVVIVGDKKEDLVSSVENVFSKTDLNRIFVVCVVVDGHPEDPTMVSDLQRIDKGDIPHWHGDRPDMHFPGQKEDVEDPHGRKVHVIFNTEKKGITASRADAVEFIKVLNKYHEEAGLKSTEEDLILLLVQSGVVINSRRWLPLVTEALIVPPPVLGKTDSKVSMKLANAVAFNTDGPSRRTSFDTTFTPILSEATAEELNESNGASYPTAAINGAIIAMRLDTYVNLPMQDHAMTDQWPADLDLSLNLWLCADGIDMIRDVEATIQRQVQPEPLKPELAARFAAAWMDDVMSKKFFHAYVQEIPEITYLEWETFEAKALESPTFTKDLMRKCRSFKWYIDEVNFELQGVLKQSENIEDQESNALEKEEEKEEEEEETTDDQQKEETDDKSKENEADHGVPPADVADEDVAIPERKGDKAKPSKPLCKECLEIVLKAKPIDISYVDVSGEHKDHPHMGARDAAGNLGYVHDETHLRKNPPGFNFSGESLEKACKKRDNNYRMLTEKVYVDLKADEEANASGKKRDKIFCLVYTTEKGHPSIPRIRETWGQKCDGFMVGSNKTDPSIDTVEIMHKGEESYENIWQKVRSMWSYVYDNYYDKYDWFHIGGDDLYLIVENLRLYLESEEIQTAQNGGIFLPDGTEKVQTPLFLGRRFAYLGDMNDIFNSGGSGYTINKAALKTLVVEGFPKYFPNAHTFSEDTMIARVFREFGVYPYETKDEFGSERYMPFMPGHHYGYRLPADKKKDWYATYSINIKEGVDHCSARSVAFHYIKEEAMYRLHAILYHLCPAGTLE